MPDWTQMEDAVAARQPDVMAVYLDQNPVPRLAAIQRLRALFPNVEVIALCDASDSDLVRQISVAGCADLVILADCPRDIRPRPVRAVRPRPGRSGPRRGPRSPSSAGRAGWAPPRWPATSPTPSRRATPIAGSSLVDLNLYRGDVAVTLDVKPQPTALFFLQRASSIDDRSLAEMPPEHPRGFRVLGLDGDLEAADPISAEQVVFLIERLRQRYDFVVLDCGTNLTEVSMAACSTADRRLIVLTEQLAARLGARRRLLALRALDPERRNIHAILNRHQDRPPDPEHIQRVEQSIGMPVLATLPNAWAEVSHSLEVGRPLLAHAPRAAITQDFLRIAEALGGDEHDADKRKRAFFDFFR